MNSAQRQSEKHGSHGLLAMLGVIAIAIVILLSMVVRVRVTTTPVGIEPLLLNAILDGATPEEVRALADSHPNSMSQLDPVFGGPLDWATTTEPSQRAEMLRVFLSLGIDPNTPSQHISTRGQLPLYEAIAVFGSSDVVQVLLEFDASTTNIDGKGRSALEIANAGASEEIRAIIREHEAKSGHPRGNGLVE